MLKITGCPVVKKHYTRVPMSDGFGPVSAVAKWNRVSYRPKGGTWEERKARATLLAREVGGVVEELEQAGTDLTYFTVTAQYEPDMIDEEA